MHVTIKLLPPYSVRVRTGSGQCTEKTHRDTELVIFAIFLINTEFPECYFRLTKFSFNNRRQMMKVRMVRCD